MKALVTGGAGFIGSNLAVELQKRFPDWEVFVLDDFSSGSFKNLLDFQGEVITGSIVEPETIDKLRKFDFNVIFHQAANVNTIDLDVKRMMLVNCEAFKAMLELAVDAKADVIYASSAAVYGNTPAPMKVNGECKPENPYGFSKYAMDITARRFMREHPELKLIGLRYFNVYGPREHHKGKMASMALQLTVQILKGKKPRLFKWGEQKRDFVYVKDCVEANIRALLTEKKNGIVNIGTGKARSFNELLDVIKKALGVEVETEYFDNPYPFYQNYTQADLTQTSEILGWVPETQIEDGVPEYIRWLKENVDIDSLSY